MCIILLKVVINGYCLKNKGIKEERIMEKKSIKRCIPITYVMFELKYSWV